MLIMSIARSQDTLVLTKFVVSRCGLGVSELQLLPHLGIAGLGMSEFPIQHERRISLKTTDKAKFSSIILHTHRKNSQ